MARGKSKPMPDSFEDFAKRHEPEATAEPDEPMVAPKAEPKQTVKPMGGMVEKTWAGQPMWECPRCGATTFDAGVARVHTCKELRFAEDAPPEEAE